MNVQNITPKAPPRERTLSDVKVGEQFERMGDGGRFVRIQRVDNIKPDLIPVVCLEPPKTGPRWVAGEVAHCGQALPVRGQVEEPPAPGLCDVLTLSITGQRREFQVLQQVLCNIAGRRGETPNGGLDALESGLRAAGCEAPRTHVILGDLKVPNTWNEFHGTPREAVERANQNARAVQ